MNKLIIKSCMTLRRIVAYILIFACMLAMTVPVYAAEDTVSKRTVKIGAFTSSGYHHKDEDGSIDGYGHEYETLLAQYANWNIQYVEGSWPELQQMLADGEIDLLGFLISTPERMKIYDYADYASGTSTSCLIAAKDNTKYAYENFEAFDGMRIAYQVKNANVDSLKDWCARESFEIETIPCDSYEAVAEAIDNGKADAGLATNFYDLSNFKIIANISSAEFFYAVTKGNHVLFKELNDAVQNINTYYPNIEAMLYEQFYDSTNGRGDTFTKEEYDYLVTHPIVTVLAGGRGAPFEEWDKDLGTYTGFVPDVLEQIAGITGLKFQYKVVDDQLAYAKEHSDEDITSSMTCNSSWAYQNGWRITQPFIQAGVSVITKDEHTEIKTVGLGTENYLRRHIESKHPNWIIQTYDTMEERLDAVFDGKCDAALMNSCEADYYITSGKYHLLHETITTDISQNIGFGVSSGSDPMLFSIISKALLMIDADTYDTLMHKNLDYVSLNNFSSLIYTNPKQVLIAATSVAVLLVVLLFLVFYTISIRRKNREVMAATRVKTDFFSRMSHDMRTPMNAILGMTALSKDEKDNAVLQRNMEQIEISGKYMLNLINDTLDLQKLETGKMELDIEPFYAEDFIHGLVEMMKPNAGAKGIFLEFENKNIELDHDVYIDQTRIKQVFTNLLSNAIKFTPEGGIIKFTAEKLGQDGDIEHDRYCVIDSGIGMSEDFIKTKIFKPYSQEDSTITSKYGGTGLGLAITKNLIEAMGGSISVESTPSEGSCFTVLLDFKIGPKKAKPIKQEETLAKKEIPQVLYGKHILLCEDHPLNAEIAKRLLIKAGCEVIHAADGKLGVAEFEKPAPGYFDAVLMDVRMPNMDGLTATKTIRALDRADAKSVPIIAMTANAYKEDIRQCMEAGMNAHLAKPVEPTKLYNELAKCMGIINKHQIH